MRRFIHYPSALTRLVMIITVVVAMVLMSGLVVAQVVQPDLLSATSFSVLAGTTVTNTGATVIGPPVGAPALGGDLGLAPGSSVTNFPPGSVVPPGVMHIADAVAIQAQTDLVTAYNTVAGATPCTVLSSPIGNLMLPHGGLLFCLYRAVYHPLSRADARLTRRSKCAVHFPSAESTHDPKRLSNWVYQRIRTL